MSLLRWKELAKSKSDLGDKINYVKNAITQNNIGQQTSQESFSKVFKPVTSKLDDVIKSNLQIAKVPKNRVKKGMRGEMEAPDYYPEVDPFEDMDVDNLFDEPVMPQNEKQIVPKPPTYEESLKDLLEGNKEIYVDPQYFPEYEDELPPEYDEDEIDYALDADDEVSEILEDVGIDDYDVVQMKLDQPEMTPKKTKNYLNKILEKAKYKRRQLKGFKANVTKEYNRGTISEAERQIKNKRISNARVALNDYIKHYESKAKTIKGSGIRKKQKGGNVIFFNDVKQLLKKLELIIGSINAGNTSVKMRNMGVAILDTLLKRSTINKQQYKQIYNLYFKV